MSNRFRKVFWKVFSLDLWLLLGLFAITGYGLLVLYSASGGSEKMFTNRVVQVSLGLGIMFVMAMIPPRTYKQISPYLYAVTIVILVMVDVFGETSKGAQRWLNLGFVRFQPSEIAKLAVPLMVATFLSNRPLPPNFRDTAIALAIIVFPTLLVAAQPARNSTKIPAAQTKIEVPKSGCAATSRVGKTIIANAITAGIFARTAYRFYFCGIKRRTWDDWGVNSTRHLSLYYCTWFNARCEVR